MTDPISDKTTDPKDFIAGMGSNARKSPTRVGASRCSCR